ncbi:MAG TPA: UDP-glucose/GDP-mannose dehydrogenase family protein [Acidimicrobiia bacterium]|nr:UDP-glucose/GDP-mannose dehydrogenase family protein [Acidimicrobiia bacterium]
MSTVGVVGAGYVGITTAACLAHLGHSVVCADIDANRVERLTKGEVPILEEGLPELVRAGLTSGLLRFEVGAVSAARHAEFVFLCVPTPHGVDGAADLTAVDDVAREIAPNLRTGAVVVNKSTMPVGSTRRVERLLRDAGAPADVCVVSNPEFLREGTAVADFLHPHRIVVGADEPAVAVKVFELYKGVQAPVVVTDAASAEIIKYASNAFLATKVSFINAIAHLCESVSADVRSVALGMGYDPRIGFEFLQPGPGWGGSCFPKDTAALLHESRTAGHDFSLLEGAVAVNDAQRERMVAKVLDAYGAPLADASVAVWGLTFKANTDDLRDSPAVAIANRLVEEGAEVRAYDPATSDATQAGLPDLHIVEDPYEACAGADVLVVLTEWDEFRWLDFERVAAAMASPSIVDARNLLDPAAMRRRGFAYVGVGR